MEKNNHWLIGLLALLLLALITFEYIMPYVMIHFFTKQVSNAITETSNQIQQGITEQEQKRAAARIAEMRVQERIDKNRELARQEHRQMCDQFKLRWNAGAAANNNCDDVNTDAQLIACKNEYIRARKNFWEQYPSSRDCPEIWNMTVAI